MRMKRPERMKVNSKTGQEMNMNYRSRQTFYKLVFGTFKAPLQKQLRIYFNGIPLHVPARFEIDRYVFPLPLNLAEKLLAGELIADFSFAELSETLDLHGKSSESPTSIILSERYA